ncbi:hypothetical protein FPK48_33455, partial [Acinetobacter baumannii]|nr:hypothetical protein [Acinetobacter baumannii]
ACWSVGAAHAQQAQAEPQSDTAAVAEATAQPPSTEANAAPAATNEASNVVRISGSRIAARGFTMPTPTTSLTSADLEKS